MLVIRHDDDEQGILTITQRLYLVMVNITGRVYPYDLDKGFSSRFSVDSRVRHEIPEEDRNTYRPKRDYNKRDVVSSPNILRNNDYRILSQKFRRIITRKY